MEVANREADVVVSVCNDVTCRSCGEHLGRGQVISLLGITW